MAALPMISKKRFAHALVLALTIAEHRLLGIYLASLSSIAHALVLTSSRQPFLAHRIALDHLSTPISRQPFNYLDIISLRHFHSDSQHQVCDSSSQKCFGSSFNRQSSLSISCTSSVEPSRCPMPSFGGQLAYQKVSWRRHDFLFQSFRFLFF